MTSNIKFEVLSTDTLFGIRLNEVYLDRIHSVVVHGPHEATEIQWENNTPVYMTSNSCISHDGTHIKSSSQYSLWKVCHSFS